MGILSLYTMWIALVAPLIFVGMVYVLVYLCTCVPVVLATPPVLSRALLLLSPPLSPPVRVVVFACSYFCAGSKSCPVLVLLLLPLSPCSVRVFLLLVLFVFGWFSSLSGGCFFFSTCMCYSGLTEKYPS